MRKFRVKFAAWRPWNLSKFKGNETLIDGIAADFYEDMRKRINFEYEAKVQEDLIFGLKTADGTWSGMLGSTAYNKCDVSGPYFINEQRTHAVEFGVPIGFSQLAIVSGMVPANKDPWLIFEIFSLEVWLYTVLVTFFATCTGYLIYTYFPSSEGKRKGEIVFKYAWMFYGSLLGKEIGPKHRWFLRSVWTSASFRGFMCFWLMGPALILMYTYQGAITSAFAADKMKPRIETLDQLQRDTSVRPGTFLNSFPSACLRHLSGTEYDPLWRRVEQNLQIPSNDKVLPWLEETAEEKGIWIAETFFMKSLVGERFKNTGKCNVRVVPIDFCSAYIAFGFNKQFPKKMLKAFNKRLRWYNEGTLTHRRFLSSTLYYDICTQTSVSATKALELNDLFAAFLVLITGIVSSVAIFSLEFFANLRRCNKLKVEDA